MSPLSLVRARYARNDHWLTHCQAVAHDTDVVAQQIHHAFISDRHVELICLLLELIEARHQLTASATASEPASYITLGAVAPSREPPSGHSLGSKILHQRDLLVGEWPHFRSVNDDGAEENSVLDHRHRHQALSSARPA